MSRLRIIARRDDKLRPKGQDVQVMLVRDDGTEVNITKEIPVHALRWSVDARSGLCTIALDVHGAEIDVEGEFTVKDIIAATEQLEAKNAALKCSVCDAEFYAFDREGKPVTDLISLTCGAHAEH